MYLYLYMIFYTYTYPWFRQVFFTEAMGWLRDLTGSVLYHRSLPPEFEPRRGHIWGVFHLSLRFITFVARSAHLAYHVHKTGRKTSIIILLLLHEVLNPSYSHWCAFIIWNKMVLPTAATTTTITTTTTTTISKDVVQILIHVFIRTYVLSSSSRYFGRRDNIYTLSVYR